MTRPRLVVITDFQRFDQQCALGRIERALALALAGTVMVQLREHARPIRERLELGRKLARLCRERGQLFAVNDRVDLALLLEADGLHLGDRSVEPSEARRLVGAMWISRACHDPTDLALRGADALVVSPIFEARHGRPPLGPGALTPGVYALGSVSADNARACLEVGAAGVAVVGAVLGQDDPRPLLQALDIQTSA